MIIEDKWRKGKGCPHSNTHLMAYCCVRHLFCGTWGSYIYIQPFNYHLTASLVQWFSVDPLVSAGALQGAILSPESYWYFLWKAGMPCYLPIAKCKLPFLNCQLLIANYGMWIAYCRLGIFRTLACASGLPLPTLLDTRLQSRFFLR